MARRHLAKIIITLETNGAPWCYVVMGHLHVQWTQSFFPGSAYRPSASILWPKYLTESSRVHTSPASFRNRDVHVVGTGIPPRGC